jgi:hypothetical protein
MKRILLSAVLIFTLSACMTFGKKTAPADDAAYYAQYSFFYKNGTHKSSNYREGTLIPINTPMKILTVGGYDLTGNEAFEVITLDGRHKITVSNVKSDSGLDLDEYKNRLLGRKKVDISAYSEQAQAFIRNGEPAKGMTKDMVLKAMGYPPVDLTPTVNASEWIYNLNLFQKGYFRFDSDGNVIDIFYR